MITTLHPRRLLRRHASLRAAPFQASVREIKNAGDGRWSRKLSPFRDGGLAPDLRCTIVGSGTLEIPDLRFASSGMTAEVEVSCGAEGRLPAWRGRPGRDRACSAI